MQIKDKVVVVTGTASGIGLALATRFVREGATVIASDMNAEVGAQKAAEIGARFVAANVAKEEDIVRLIDDVYAHEGPIDLFCSNAGIAIGAGPETLDRHWQLINDVNVMSHVWAARHLVPRMLERGEGYLLNTASAAGLLASMGSAPYGVTKHAGVALAEHLSIQYGDRGIRVSVLCPQAVDTNMLRMAGATAASVDGVLNTDAVAQTVIEAMDAETFLILTHAEVKEYMGRKLDRDRWLRGMRRLRDKTGEKARA